jgi:hypothetical protein
MREAFRLTLNGRIIEPNAVSTHGIDVLMCRVDRRDAVPQAADERVQGLV